MNSVGIVTPPRWLWWNFVERLRRKCVLGLYQCVVELLRLVAIMRRVRISCVAASLRQHIELFLDCRVSWRPTIDDTLSQQTLHSDISAYADAWRRTLAHAQLCRSHRRCCPKCQRSRWLRCVWNTCSFDPRQDSAIRSKNCFIDVSVMSRALRSPPCRKPQDVVFNWETTAVRAHERQCDDPPKEVRASAESAQMLFR